MPQITSYNQLAAAAADDVLPIVDVHDDTMSPQGTTKKITVGTLNAAATGGVAISGTPSVGEILTATGPASADWQEPTPVIDTTASDIQPSPATQAAGATGLAADAGHVHGQPPFVAPTGLTGATAASRYAGATTSGAPVSGSFAKGDYVIDQTGAVWVCYNAGAPGNWQKGGGGGFTNPMTTLGDMIDGGASGTPTRLAGNTTTASEFLNSTGTGSAATAPAWKAIASTDLPLATTGAPGAVELAGDLGGTGTSPGGPEDPGDRDHRVSWRHVPVPGGERDVADTGRQRGPAGLQRAVLRRARQRHDRGHPGRVQLCCGG